MEGADKTHERRGRIRQGREAMRQGGGEGGVE